MKQKKQYRIDGFQQSKVFFSSVLNNLYPKISQSDIALYCFLLNQGNLMGWMEWFSCDLSYLMQGSCLSKSTYGRSRDNLKKFNLIDFQKGINGMANAKFKIIPLVYNEQLIMPMITETEAPKEIELPSDVLPYQREAIKKLIMKNLNLFINKHYNEFAKTDFNFKKLFSPALSDATGTSELVSQNYDLNEHFRIKLLADDVMMEDVGIISKVTVTEESVKIFNADLRIAQKVHDDYNEYCNHLKFYLKKEKYELNGKNNNKSQNVNNQPSFSDVRIKLSEL